MLDNKYGTALGLLLNLLLLAYCVSQVAVSI
jgi:hypothetical protein